VEPHVTRTGTSHPLPAGAPPDAADAPIIAVVVPTYDRPHALEACLRALAAQTLARDQFEVIVADDGSTAPVAAIPAGVPGDASRTLQLRVVRQENVGPAAARNLGAASARARYLAFTDDDCEPAPDWLERLLARLEAGPDILVGGGMRNGRPTNACAAATQAIMDFVYGEHWRRSGTRLFSTSNLSLSAAGFRKIGGFSPQFPDAAGEDYDLCWRWQESGGRAEYAPEAVIVHCHALTFRAYLRQHFRYGRGLLRVRRRRAARNRKYTGPGAYFYVRLVLHPVRRWRDVAAWRCALLIAASQMATAVGAAVELVRPSRRAPPLEMTQSAAESV
jgi:GT2 family glycosyltransferase